MILVAIGSNLAGAYASSYQGCIEAVEALASRSTLRVVTHSNWYRSAPIPRSSQPDFINGVVRLAPARGAAEPDPAVLLAALHELEAEFGRVRSVANAARTLDLDLIAMGEGGRLRRERPDPVLPHPRAHLRSFVLLPLRDVAPGWIHPVTGLSVEAMIARLPATELAPEAISRLDPLA